MADDDGKRKERVIFPMSYYSSHKKDVKKPFKKLSLKWQYLGQEGDTTKGRYSKEGVSVFVLYSGDHADFTITGTDHEAIETILEAWSDMETLEPEQEAAPESPADKELRKALERWRLQEPQRRPGEPDVFFERRVEDWQEKDPREQ